MKTTSLVALGALALGTALTVGTPTTANADVAVRIGVAAPATECVVWRKNRNHRRVVRYAYCAHPTFTGGPVIIDGVTYRENLHFRHRNGHREFWIKGRWVVHD